ncbi:hypothetical protein HK096_000917, partial [Nowakowskiella sp. JEL0078]
MTRKEFEFPKIQFRSSPQSTKLITSTPIPSSSGDSQLSSLWNSIFYPQNVVETNSDLFSSPNRQNFTSVHSKRTQSLNTTRTTPTKNPFVDSSPVREPVFSEANPSFLDLSSPKLDFKLPASLLDANPPTSERSGLPHFRFSINSQSPPKVQLPTSLDTNPGSEVAQGRDHKHKRQSDTNRQNQSRKRTSSSTTISKGVRGRYTKRSAVASTSTFRDNSIPRLTAFPRDYITHSSYNRTLSGASGASGESMDSWVNNDVLQLMALNGYVGGVGG